jgi:hypothetical protein
MIYQYRISILPFSLKNDLFAFFTTQHDPFMGIIFSNVLDY